MKATLHHNDQEFEVTYHIEPDDPSTGHIGGVRVTHYTPELLILTPESEKQFFDWAEEQLEEQRDGWDDE